MGNMENRRPLNARSWNIIQFSAKWLSRRKVTPNQISLASIIFAALSGLCLIYLPEAGTSATWLLSFMAAFSILCRALCNVFDGLVAIEGGKKTRSGELFNDMPDRIADTLILVSAGYAATIVDWAPVAGWCASLLAVMTAYVRTLARSIGAPSNFQGPMSKVGRMALIFTACILTPLEQNFWPQGTMLLAALILIITGCILTIWNRALAAHLYLERNADV
jgi:phosphatidylglycerophosphate synthase